MSTSTSTPPPASADIGELVPATVPCLGIKLLLPADHSFGTCQGSGDTYSETVTIPTSNGSIVLAWLHVDTECSEVKGSKLISQGIIGVGRYPAKICQVPPGSFPVGSGTAMNKYPLTVVTYQTPDVAATGGYWTLGLFGYFPDGAEGITGYGTSDWPLESRILMSIDQS